MMKSVVQMYVGHQMLSTRRWSCALTKSVEFWLRTVEKMGLLLSYDSKAPPHMIAGPMQTGEARRRTTTPVDIDI